MTDPRPIPRLNRAAASTRNWAEALPFYPQARGALHTNRGYCCLGVRTELALGPTCWELDHPSHPGQAVVRSLEGEPRFADTSYLPGPVADQLEGTRDGRITVRIPRDVPVGAIPAVLRPLLRVGGTSVYGVYHDAMTWLELKPEQTHFHYPTSLAELNDDGGTPEQIRAILLYCLDDGAFAYIND